MQSRFLGDEGDANAVGGGAGSPHRVAAGCGDPALQRRNGRQAVFGRRDVLVPSIPRNRDEAVAFPGIAQGCEAPTPAPRKAVSLCFVAHPEHGYAINHMGSPPRRTEIGGRPPPLPSEPDAGHAAVGITSPAAAAGRCQHSGDTVRLPPSDHVHARHSLHRSHQVE